MGVENSLGSRLPYLMYRTLKGDDDGDDEEEHFGVHVEYEDLYDSVVFLVAIYVAGQLASKILKMPCLVGEIIAGIILGPPLVDYVPNPEAWVLLGEIGLILLVLEAGIDIDVSTLKLIGTRGCLVAIVGSVLPIAFGIALAFGLIDGDETDAEGEKINKTTAAIAAGCSFGPTSLGIALNILRGGGVLNTPVGQLIISAAVIDDMIALIILSQLESLVGSITVAGVLIPVVSALGYLLIGGYVAIFLVPGVVEKLVLQRAKSEYHGKLELAIMFALLLIMMPATYYAKASYLMGAFVAGLAFCTSHELHVTFVTQFKRLMQWLMRIFFAASIGFQVPIKDFKSGPVIWKGLVFCGALIGKLIVGFMVPNFTQSHKFTGLHLRDCLITGFSMAAEGEFAFVIAVYAVSNGLIGEDTYASVVLAVLLSTIIPPFLLRFTISYYNKKVEEDIKQLAEDEMEKNHSLEADTSTTDSGREDALVGEIKNMRAVFLCIQTQSESRWGLLLNLMSCMGRLGLDVIDHRSWHPRGINTTLVNEIYCKDRINIERKGSSQEVLDARIDEIRAAIEKVIKQPDSSNVKVQRWFPGVVEEIIESVQEQSDSKTGKKNLSLNLEERLLKEAAQRLDAKQTMTTSATKEKTVEEILAGMQNSSNIVPPEEETPTPTAEGGAAKPRPARRRRQKMRSTPVVGGGLFGETDDHKEDKQEKPSAAAGAAKKWKPDFDFGRASGHKAEIIVEGESYNVRLSDETLKSLRTGFSGDMLDTRGMSISGGMSGISIEPDSSSVVNQLHGFVRSVGTLSKITEEVAESESETSSIHPDGQHPPV